MSDAENAVLRYFEQLLTAAGAALPSAVATEQQEMQTKIVLSCGAELDTKVFLPVVEGTERFPVILVRNPYSGHTVLMPVFFRLFTEQGYAVVFVSVRGALGSTGDWLPFEHEREDGRAVIDWTARQPWCDGNIGTWGASYLGHTQWSLADYSHPALKAMFISVYGTSGYDLFWRRGMFRQEVWTPWAAQMMEGNRLQGAFPPDFGPAAQSYRPQEKLGEHLVGKRCDWYCQWIQNTKESDPYWSEGFWGEFEQGGKDACVPIFLQGGWFDIFQRSQFRAFRQLPEATRAKSRFVIGPWDHGDPAFGIVLGKAHYPQEDILGFMCIPAAIEWFDHLLKGKPYPHKKGVIEAYCLGESRWHRWKADIPHDGSVTLWLNAQGKTLVSQNAASGAVEYDYDPVNPIPTRGMPALNGDAATPGLDDNKLHQPQPNFRDDVISFISEPMDEDLTVAGAMKATLYVRSDAPATAFTVNVMELRADGESDSIREDITDIRWRDEKTVLPYTPGEAVRLELTMKDILYRVKKGSRIRVDIASSNFPQYHIHPNTDEDWSKVETLRPAHQTILCGGDTPSCIELPILRQS